MPTPPPPIDELPPAPARSMPDSEFMDKSDDWVAAQPPFREQLVASAAATYDNAVEAADAATTAVGASSSAAGAAASAAATAAYKGEWSTLSGAAAVPFSVSHEGAFWTLNTGIADIAAHEPGVAPEWTPVGSPVGQRTVAGGSITIQPGDALGMMVLTGDADATFTLASAAAMGRTVVRIGNEGTAVLTLAVTGGDTVDETSGYVMLPNEVRDVYCDGVSAYASVIVRPFSVTYTESGTFPALAPGYAAAEGQLWGGGGSGRKDTSASAKTGGLGGSAPPFRIPRDLMAASTAFTIGAGGASQTGTGNGNAGGDSTFGSMVTAKGGPGGTNGTTSGAAAYNNSNPATVGGQTSSFNDGFYGSSRITVYGGSVNSAKTVWAGAHGGGINSNDAIAAPGITVFGGAGGEAVLAGDGADGVAPGGGGGATKTGSRSGAGARGELRVWGRVS